MWPLKSLIHMVKNNTLHGFGHFYWGELWPWGSNCCRCFCRWDSKDTIYCVSSLLVMYFLSRCLWKTANNQIYPLMGRLWSPPVKNGGHQSKFHSICFLDQALKILYAVFHSSEYCTFWGDVFEKLPISRFIPSWADFEAPLWKMGGTNQNSIPYVF